MVSLQLLEQPRLAQYLSIQTLSRNEQNGELQRVRRVDIFAADLFRTAFDLVLKVTAELGDELAITSGNRLLQMVVSSRGNFESMGSST